MDTTATAKAREAILRQQQRAQEHDGQGTPQPNVGVQFTNIEDNPDFRKKDPSEETAPERQYREIFEKFYDER